MEPKQKLRYFFPFLFQALEKSLRIDGNIFACLSTMEKNRRFFIFLPSVPWRPDNDKTKISHAFLAKKGWTKRYNSRDESTQYTDRDMVNEEEK
jgi:hypothetical protein